MSALSEIKYILYVAAFLLVCSCFCNVFKLSLIRSYPFNFVILFVRLFMAKLLLQV